MFHWDVMKTSVDRVPAVQTFHAQAAGEKLAHVSQEQPMDDEVALTLNSDVLP